MKTEILNELCEIIKNRDLPDPNLAKRHSIKIGLRNEDGTGVVVGMTTKGKVIGYKKENDQKVDVPGELYYCGMNIKDLINASYEETAYLLLTGELPTKGQLINFSEYLKKRRSLSVKFRNELLYIINNNMMNSLQLAVTNLYGEDEKPDSIEIEDVVRHSIDLIAKFPAIIAYIYNIIGYKYHGKDLKLINSLEEGSHAENFLHLFRAGEKYTEDEIEILDKFLILHAEHGGGNNSTFTVRTVTSSETDTFSAITAGIASLKGHLHGGANEKVMEMMEDIKKKVKNWDDKEEIKEYLKKILKKEAGDGTGKIYGVGHAVYTISDPRAEILKEYARQIAEKKGRLNEFTLLNTVAELSPIVFAELKGTKKVISPNVDFYSGLVLDCLNIPKALYTPLFATARIAGWTAHRLEQLVQNRIMRPAYFSVAVPKEYLPLEERK